jgi:hypothetical protein
MLDFDFDGVIDAWVYFDAAGRVRRRENDYDRDGHADEIWLLAAGVVVEQQRATALAGKLDTWHYFAAGKLTRTERDANGDDYIDQWWEYPQGRSADCPLIHSDVDGDGQPDPGATVDVCRDQARLSASGDDPGAVDPTGVSDAPTELTAPPAAPPDAAGSEPPASNGGASGPPQRVPEASR